MTLFKLFLENIKKQIDEAMGILYFSMLVGIGFATGIGIVLAILGVE